MSRALKEAEKRLKSEPQNLGLRVQVAGLMREAGRSTEAVELYRSVALAYRDQGRNNQAIAVCRSILEIAPDDVACNALLSQLSGSQPPATSSSTRSSPPSSPSVPTLRPPTHRPQTPSSPPGSAPPVSRAPTPSRPPLYAPPTPPPGPPSRPPVRIPSPQPARIGSQPPSRTGSQPPSTSSRPSIKIPPKDPSKPPSHPPGHLRPRTPSRPQTEVPPAASRAATAPPPPPAAAARLPLEPPARRSSGQTTNPDAARRSSGQTTRPDALRRSSGELTPLPKAVPHHVYDPTGRSKRVDIDDLDQHDTNPDAQPRARTTSNTGLAEAARKITGLINRDEDVAGPMDTRPVRKIRSEELRKITQPPPTGEHQRLSDEEILTQPHDSVTKPGPGDEELTTPRDLIDDEEDD
ncbi:MAG TPA: tetratricopeptide repeat protein [Kofleriaceae bacterium]|nr:tetratricopeptide repeat protein [Kofleriaceae bacterium]